MTTDELIATDLAVLARATHANVPSVDDLVRAIVPAAAPAVPRDFAHHVAVACASGVALLGAIVLVVYECLGWISTGELMHGNAFDRAMAGDPWVLGVAVGAVGLAVYCLARLAWRSVRADASAIARARRWSVIGAIVAPLALILVIGMAYVAIGFRGFAALRAWGSVRDLSVETVAVAIVGSMVAAIVVERVRPARTGLMIGLGIPLFVITVVVGMLFDSGPVNMIVQFGIRESAGLRWVLTASGTTALFLVISGVVLRRTRR